jgi:hypothetical protein
MVAITVVASHALLEIDMGQVGDQLRENSSADIHPPLFRPRLNAPPVDFRPISVQIVFSSRARYTADFKSFTGFRKVLYRTPVKRHIWKPFPAGRFRRGRPRAEVLIACTPALPSTHLVPA